MKMPKKTHKMPSKSGYTVPRGATFKKKGKGVPDHETVGAKSKQH